MKQVFFLFLSAIFFVGPVCAATVDNPAYRQVVLQSCMPASSGFQLSFLPDENLCRQKYGKKWREKCAAAVGMPGKEEKNISISPNIAGTWRWLDGNRLQFSPEDKTLIKPSSKYNVDLGGLYVPDLIKLDKTRPFLQTMPETVRLLSSEFWIDPSPAANHRLAAAIDYSYPVSFGHILPELILEDGVKAGKAEAVWNAEKDRLHISWPIKDLSPNQSLARIVFQGFGQLREKEGEFSYISAEKGTNGTAFLCNIPGRNNLFKIKNASIRKKADENLNREFVLSLETSLYAKPSDVISNLQIWELPVFNSEGAVEPYNWSMAPAISAFNLERSRKIVPVCLEEGSTPRSRFNFSLPAGKGRYLFARIAPELKSASGQGLANPWFSILRVPQSSPDLAFMQPGNILPLKSNGKIGLYSTDLEKISWKLEKIREPFLALIAQSADKPFIDYLAPGNMDLSSFSLIREGELPLPEPDEGKAQFSTLDFTDFYGKFLDDAGGPARLTLTGYIDGKPVASAAKLVMPTNLAIIVKARRDGGLDCFAGEIDSGQPAEGVDFSILGANGLAIKTARTDSKGHVFFESMNGFKMERKPVAIIAQKQKDLAWLSLADRSRELDYAAFPVSGNHVSSQDVNLYSYGQRNVYRPGEILHFGVIARKGDFSVLPADLPLFAEIIDPSGLKLWEKTFKAGENGFSELAWLSPETAKSGKYFLNIRAVKDGDILASVSARIENFLPETIKLQITPPAVKGWLKAGDNAASVNFNLQNLYGTPSAGNRLKTVLQTTPAQFNFPGYERWTFTDSAPFMGKGNSLQLADCITDKNGKASLDLPMERFAASSAMVYLLSEGLEKGGGRATTAQASLLISPMEKILGYRLTGNLVNPDFIGKGNEATLEFVSLNPELVPVEWDNLEFSILHKKYVTSLISDGNGGYRYDDLPLNLPVSSQKLALPSKGLKFDLKTDEPGDYILLVTDASGRAVSSFEYTVAGNQLRKAESPLSGSKMRLGLDKRNYAPGESVKCALTLPYDAYGLIAIEREGIENFVWFSAKAGESIHSITIPDEFEGKGYVTITAARDLESPVIYVEPLSFSAVPFSSNMNARNMGLKIEAPKDSVPGKSLDVLVSSPNPGSFILFAVDEGVLMLDGYKRPEPLEQLLGNRALDVRTLQTLDLLMPDQSRLISRRSPFGGGMAGAHFGMRFQNPFKRRAEPPVTYWSGLMKISDEPVRLSIPIPDYYTGKIKIMAVGAGNENCGVASADSLISAPLVIKPQIPLAVAPGDEFEAVFLLENTMQQPLKAELDISFSASLSSVSSFPAAIELEPGSQKIIPLVFKVADIPGESSISLKAVCEKGVFARQASLSIRPVSPYRQSIKGGRLEHDAVLETGRTVYPFNAKGGIAVDSSPFPLLQAFARYLETYPYGCTEQLISRAFGQILLPENEKSPNAEKLLASVFSALRERSSYSGISLWPGSEPDLLLTAYGVDFLLTLREKGNYSNQDLLEMLCDALEANCTLNEAGMDAARTVAYALWVLTRSGRITTRHLENLVAALDERGLINWENDLTAVFMAASKKEMRINVPFPARPKFTASSAWFDEYVQNAMYVAIMSRYFPEHLDGKMKNEFFDATIVNLNNNAYATFSSLQGLRALQNISQSGKVYLSSLKVECLDEADNIHEWINSGYLRTSVCNKFKISGLENSGPVFWQISQEGFDIGQVKNDDFRGIKINKKLLDANGKDTDSFQLGDEVNISVTVSSMDGKPLECVLVDLLPGGMEMIFPAGDSDAELLGKIRYLDRQEDRMLIFANLDNQPKTFNWKARAVTSGKFVIPPAYAEDMRNKGRYGLERTRILNMADEAAKTE